MRLSFLGKQRKLIVLLEENYYHCNDLPGPSRQRFERPADALANGARPGVCLLGRSAQRGEAGWRAGPTGEARAGRDRWWVEVFRDGAVGSRLATRRLKPAPFAAAVR